jgi:hypothetical protein
MATLTKWLDQVLPDAGRVVVGVEDQNMKSLDSSFDSTGVTVFMLQNH